MKGYSRFEGWLFSVFWMASSMVLFPCNSCSSACNASTTQSCCCSFLPPSNPLLLLLFPMLYLLAKQFFTSKNICKVRHEYTMGFHWIPMLDLISYFIGCTTDLSCHYTCSISPIFCGLLVPSSWWPKHLLWLPLSTSKECHQLQHIYTLQHWCWKIFDTSASTLCTKTWIWTCANGIIPSSLHIEWPLSHPKEA